MMGRLTGCVTTSSRKMCLRRNFSSWTQKNPLFAVPSTASTTPPSTSSLMTRGRPLFRMHCSNDDNRAFIRQQIIAQQVLRNHQSPGERRLCALMVGTAVTFGALAIRSCNDVSLLVEEEEEYRGKLDAELIQSFQTIYKHVDHILNQVQQGVHIPDEALEQGIEEVVNPQLDIIVQFADAYETRSCDPSLDMLVRCEASQSLEEVQELAQQLLQLMDVLEEVWEYENGYETENESEADVPPLLQSPHEDAP